MKILIVRTYPNQLNTDKYNVQEIGLAAALIRKGIKCDIVMFLENGKSHTEDRTDGIRIYWIKGIGILKNGFFPHISNIMKEYDVIQVHEYDQIQSWIIYTFMNKRNNVVMYHGPYYDTFNKGYNFKCKIFDRIFLPFSRKAKKSLPCITKSPLAADFLRKKGFERVTAAGVGLDVLPFNEGKHHINQVAEKMPADRKNIIYVGKLEERRNTIFLLEVMSELADDANIYFTIVGDGSDEYMMRVMPIIEELKIKGVLQYIKGANQQELGEIYKKADIMLFPSSYEIFGMVLMEAMYFGVVCVSSLNGGSSCLISNNEDGIIIDKMDKNEWVYEIRRLVGSSELGNMGKRAASKIKENFLWDRIAETFIKVYSDALN